MNDGQYKKFDSVSVENIALDLKKRSKVIDDAMKKILDNRILKDKEIFNSNYLQSCKSFIYLKNYYLTLCESIDLLASFLLKNVLPNYNEFSSLIVDKFDFNFSSDVAKILDISVNFAPIEPKLFVKERCISEPVNNVADVSSVHTQGSYSVAPSNYSQQGTISDKLVDAAIETDNIEKLSNSVLSNRAVIPKKTADENIKANSQLNLAAIGAVGAVAGLGVLGGTKLVKQSINEEKNDDNDNRKNITQNVEMMALSKDDLVDKIEKGEVVENKVVPVNTNNQKTTNINNSGACQG